MSVPVHPIAAPWGRFALFSFLIDGPELAIVDTGVTASAAGLPAQLEELGRRIEDVKWILLTHGHIDHVGGAFALWEATRRQAKVVISEVDAHFLRSREAHVEEALSLRGDYVGAEALRAKKSGEVLEAISGEMEPSFTVKDGDVLDLGGVSVRIVAVPGHTAGAVAYVLEQGNGETDVFIGDAAQGYGAASGFPGYEDPDAYRDSLRRVLDIEPTRLYLGHPYRDSSGTPRPVALDAAAAAQHLRDSLARETDVRAAVAEYPPRPSESPYTPFEVVAEALGYTGDPTLEPSPFFTSLHGYAKELS